MYKGVKMWVHHVEGETIMTGWERRPERQDKINLYVWGQDPEPIKQFMEDCVTLSIQKDDGKVKIWELHPWGCGWTKVQSKKPRSIESVVLDQDKAGDIINDIKRF